MKWHSRCSTCRARRKLAKHPFEYRRQPRCQCGSRGWSVDTYRQNTEKHQWRIGSGRYERCYSDCYHHPHRIGSTGCKFDPHGEYRLIPAM